MVDTLPSTADVWEWLDAVPDPEIPVISVVDLGIVRDVAWEGETLVVTVTPTYSGCPATTVISLDIETALRAKGIADMEYPPPAVPGLDHGLALGQGPREARSLRHRATAARRRAGTLPPLRGNRPRTDQPVRLHPLQGSLAVQKLP